MVLLKFTEVPITLGEVLQLSKAVEEGNKFFQSILLKLKKVSKRVNALIILCGCVFVMGKYYLYHYFYNKN